LALHGGEDYELLFTVSPKNEIRLRRAPGFREIRKIGEIVRGGGIMLIGKGGSAKRLVPGGWDPFRRAT
jgi:thiamine-monophosphate kinase